jgi:hypothetical protein
MSVKCTLPPGCWSGSAQAGLAQVGTFPLVKLGHYPQLGLLPSNIHVERWVNQADAVFEAGVVLCHGGSGTAFGALAAAVPLVMVPALRRPVRKRQAHSRSRRWSHRGGEVRT